MSGLCFVTVGTTRFDDLINAMMQDNVLAALRKIGINKLVMQIGAGDFEKTRFTEVFGDSRGDEGRANYAGVQIEFYRYKNSIALDIERATVEMKKCVEVVVGHAGAGTVLESLGKGRPLVVVVNEKLMDNHQFELASKLASLGHLVYCIPSGIEGALTNSSLFNLEPFTPPDISKVAGYVNRLMGVSETHTVSS